MNKLITFRFSLPALLLVIVLTFSVRAQTIGKVSFQQIRVSTGGADNATQDVVIPFEWKKKTEEQLLFKNDQVTIMARYKITSPASARSSVKNTALNVHIDYTCVYNGIEDKRSTEKIFYLDQERKFVTEEVFAFKEALRTSSVRLNYTGVLLE